MLQPKLSKLITLWNCITFCRTVTDLTTFVGTLKVPVLPITQHGLQLPFVSILTLPRLVDITPSPVSEEEIGSGNARKQNGLNGAKAVAAEVALQHLKEEEAKGTEASHHTKRADVGDNDSVQMEDEDGYDRAN